jgi:nicotinamidase-related amidase
MPTIAAAPFPYEFPVHGLVLIVIDMQHDFLEPGGFGEALGNNVAPLAAIIPTVRQLLDGFRALRRPIIHTKEAHRPDLSDCPPAKRQRGKPTLHIGDPGPMGCILIAAEPGNNIVPALAPQPGEAVLEKPGKGAFYRIWRGRLSIRCLHGPSRVMPLSPLKRQSASTAGALWCWGKPGRRT